MIYEIILTFIASAAFAVMGYEIFKIRKKFDSHIWIPIVTILTIDGIQMFLKSTLNSIELIK